MSVAPELEPPRPPAGDGFSDAVTFAFAEPRADLYGVARLGLTAAGASGLVLLFHGGEPVAVRAEGGVAVAGRPASWEQVAAAGLGTEVLEPLRSWSLRFDSEEASFELRFDAAGAIAELAPGHRAAKAGGMQGYEQPGRVRGEVRVGAERVEVDGLGQRGHSWGAPDWERIALARTLSAWFGEDLALSLVAVRPARAKGHAEEAVAASILEGARDGEGGGEAAAVVLEIEDARLSTTYDGEGRQQRAGLELHPDPDGYARRAAGEVICGTSLDLGRLRLDCAFFRWRMEGREGVGRYDVLRRADAA
jgi:hypothetical protein